MSKFIHYLFGIILVICAGVLFSWFYNNFNEIIYSIKHITNPQYFARILAPITSLYLGLFYLYCAIKNKITFAGKISLSVLVIGLLISVIIMLFTPYYFGGTTPTYAIIMDSVWRMLVPLSIFITVVFSFVSLFKKS